MDILKFKEQLGKRIKTYRLKRGYTQEQFCEIIGLDPSNLSNIERGKTLPDITTVYAIIKKAKVEPNFLFGFTNNDSIKYSSLDYEIIDLFKNLPIETKTLIKNCLELIKQ